MCGECGVTVKDSDKAVSCDVCEVWFHIECEKLPEEVYNFMQDEEAGGVLMWYCSHCKKGCAKLHKCIKRIEQQQVEQMTRQNELEGKINQLREFTAQEHDKNKEIEVRMGILEAKSIEINDVLETNAKNDRGFENRLGTLEARTVGLEGTVDSGRATGSATEVKQEDNTGKPEPVVEGDGKYSPSIALQEVKPKHYRYEPITAEYNLEGYDIIEQNLLNKEGRDLYKDEEKVQKTVNDQEKADVLSEQFSRVFTKEPDRGTPTANKKDGYHMYTTIKKTTVEKDIVVVIDDKLTFSDHLAEKINKANKIKIYKTRARLNLRRHSFTSSVVNNWNSLPEWVVNVETVEKFEAKLDKYWKNQQQISDDEDDTHPNIDTPSLFRWRHQARLERMAEKEKELEKIKKEKQEYDRQVKTLKQKLETEPTHDSTDMSKLKEALAELEKKGANLLGKQKDLEKKEKLEPWNVDTISSDGFSKTIINKPGQRNADDLSEEEKEKRMKEFVKKNESDIKKYGMFRNFDDSPIPYGN
ncbi:Hsp90 co-chaperone Cdc37-like, partial [Homarus americanus]